MKKANGKKILIVTQYFWPESFPVNDLALSLLEMGHQITVATGIPNYPEGRFFSGYGLFKKMRQDYHGIKVIRSPLIPRGKGGMLRLSLNFFSFALSTSLSAIFRFREKYDLIFVYEPSPVTVGLPAIVLKKLKSVPIFFWVQDLWPESLSATGAVRSKALLKIVERMVCFIYQGCDKILVQSRAFFGPIERLGIDSGCISYFPNSAEELYQPVILEQNAPERDDMPGGFCVMFAGNIGAAQDFGTILCAAERLKDNPNIHWVIIGDGRMRSWVEEQITEKNLSETVHLFGRHPVKAMPRYFSLADVLLVTLRKEHIFSLTIPSKIQSYLACGKPILAALDGEGSRIIEEADGGFAVPAENPNKLAEAVLAMYNMSKTERQKLGKNSRNYFEKQFDRNILLYHLDAWIKEVSFKKC